VAQRNVETFLGRLVTNPIVRRRFGADPALALREFQEEGYELTAIELDALAAMKADAIRSLADSIDRRIRWADPTLGADPSGIRNRRDAMQVTTKAGSEERMVRANGVDLRAQTFGDPRHPALLLIAGAASSMKRWPEEFCAGLAEAGRFVIRYDNRDTGRSSVFPVGAPGYSIRDMADDAVGVLDAYGVERAHVAGWSMGGMITQNIAIYHPNRIRSAFLFGTTPDGSAIACAATGAGTGSATLSGPPQQALDLFAFLATVDWRDEAQAIDAWLREDLVLLGPGDTPRPDIDRVNVTLVVREARDIVAHRKNHGVVVATSYWRDRLNDIRTPTLVMHGTHDYCLGLDHAQALASEIPGARLVVVEGMGHVLSPTSGYWKVFADALIAHTASVA
jgi:pimeloyl-ACP methyl ester carboxylesterase